MHLKRIPEFVLPDQHLLHHCLEQNEDYSQAKQDAEHLRNKLRPDVMVVEMTMTETQQRLDSPDVAPLSSKMPDGKQRKVWIAEGGYCADTRYEHKLLEKQQQHRHLQDALTQYGYKIEVLPIFLGFYGSIFSTTQQSVQKLGVDRARSNKLMTCLHAQAITSLHTIVKLRRTLERSATNRRRLYPRHRANPP